ncbi:MAG: sel1 repeat family protein [Candidatus Moraniibacteriota bacterium]|nr:MAG: sel1 repeat family protein [Candidatus Moranbacteria bacterium]
MSENDPLSPGFPSFGKNYMTLNALSRHRQNRRDVLHRKTSFADNGSADISFLMGDAHSKGHFPRRDPEQAFLWWRDAAERGHAQAMIALGVCLIVGYGTGKDRDQASYWLKRAGREGDKKARSMLAQAYSDVRRQMQGLDLGEGGER